MVGLYWSLGEWGEGGRSRRGGGGVEEGIVVGDVIGGFSRASAQHLHWLRDVTSPHSETTEVNLFQSCISSLFIT